MNGALEKIVDRFPPADGALRRRFIAGGFVTLFLLFTGILPITEVVKIDIAVVIGSPVFVFAFLILVYAIGGIVEVIGQIFILRAIGELAWMVAYPYKKNRSKGIGRVLLSYSIWLIPGYFLSYFYFFRGLLGITKFHLDLRLSANASKIYDQLPERVQTGLSQPLGDEFDFAWKFLESKLRMEDKQWVHRRDARNKEVLAILSAMTIVAAMGAVLLAPRLGQTLTDVSNLDSQYIIFAVQIGVLIIILAYRGYFLLLHSSIKDAIEIMSLSEDLDNVESETRRVEDFATNKEQTESE